MKHSIRLIGLGFCLAVAACGQTGETGPTDAAAPVAPGDDACGAAGLQSLVGTGAGALDPAALPEGARVLFPGMAATTDFRADRLNVSVGSGDKVDRVFCG